MGLLKKSALGQGKPLGNTTGNYANGGLAVKYGDLFYVTQDNKLFRMRTDGEGIQDTGLVPGKRYSYLTSLSVVGRTLCYAIANHDTGLAIYRADLGAEAAPRPSSPKLVFADRKEKNFRGALVVGDQVVYSTTDGLFKVDKRGKRETLAEGWCNNKGVVGNTVYFHIDPLYARHDQLRRVDLDGSDLQTLLPIGEPPKRLNSDDHSYGSLNVFGDWLYYVSYDAALGSRVIHRVRPDGTGEERLNDKETYTINVVGHQIFFINSSDARRLYRINIDGSQETCLDARPHVTSTHVFDDLVFCSFSLDEKFIPAKMFTIQTDGSGHRELF